MAGSTLGTHFKIMTWGESHGAGVGVVVDGCPAGLPLTEADIQVYLDRRKPGQSLYSTPRKEADQVEILSGVFEGLTTGTPISLMIKNTSHRSADYSEIANYFRPGHADLVYEQKYGFRDYRGGGRSSARETIGRVAAGAIAAKVLKELGVSFTTYTASIGSVSYDPRQFDPEEIFRNPIYMPDKSAAEKAAASLDECKKNQDSSGGIVECRINGVKPGIGNPCFDKLSSCLGKAILSINAVKGFEIGDGFAVGSALGSTNNDTYRMEEGKPVKETNHSGGITGGISEGSEIVFRAAFKPTPSISRPQKTVNRFGEEITVQIKGRHDPVVVPRAVVVVEAMAALTVLDLLLENMGTRMEYVKAFYENI